jgi:hypothetical protein
VDGRPAVKALIREIQRDSVRPAEILHLDLYEVRADEKVTLAVPIHLIGISLFVRDLKVEKAEVLNDPDTPVCTVVAPRTEEAPAPVEEAAAAAEPELIRKPKPEDEAEAEPKA